MAMMILTITSWWQCRQSRSQKQWQDCHQDWFQQCMQELLRLLGVNDDYCDGGDDGGGGNGGGGVDLLSNLENELQT